MFTCILSIYNFYNIFYNNLSREQALPRRITGNSVALGLVMDKSALALPLNRCASLSAHLQELDGLEVSKLMGSDSIKA